MKVTLDRYSGPATVTAVSLGKFKLRVQVERNGESQPLNVHVELPATGRDTWPANDVEVRDETGTALVVHRTGIEWEKLLVPVADNAGAFIVQALEPPIAVPRTRSDKDRVIQDAVSGAQVRIANWPQGRVAALSIRFDDSHPTHLSKAVPILREYGFKGTFMVNPGPKEPGSRQNYTFQTQQAEWEALMKQGDMELANHSAHHRGAKGDEDMDREIGSAAEAIWKLTPGKSKLMALNLGGGTRWETTGTLRHYLDKYHQFDASSGSLGMDDSYGRRVEAFRKALETHLSRGLWCRVHYHYIGEGLSSSEANFRAALDIAKQHQDKLWIAGMADIYKYRRLRILGGLVRAM
ncbi:MAG: polysaccharide deacetylase family protein [Verrucomicrobia bacterium]|nr:polysaccharide deacetylase family protein [Verrucomicrobiota bacterium]